MRRMTRRPTHPGKIIKEDYLLPLSITIKDLAASLGVSRKTLSKIVNERGAITPDMALRLSRAFDTTPDLWLNLQKNFDLYQAETESQEWKKVKSFPQQILHDHTSADCDQVNGPEEGFQS
jgi:addiction module HigA family antidote